MTPRLLLLGGLDPCGGAGISADAVTAAHHGVHALPVAVVLTIQNRHGFASLHPVPLGVWQAALAAALADGEVGAVKLGLLGAEAIPHVAAALRPMRGRVPIVVDPVLSATAGGYAPAGSVAQAYLDHLLPLASVLTPNLAEAAALFGGDARSALATGCRAVLTKGGHGTGDTAVDVLSQTAAAECRFARRRLPIGAVHGTGCALATALACELAHGATIALAAERAGDWLWGQLAALGPAPVDGLPRPLSLADSPSVSRTFAR